MCTNSVPKASKLSMEDTVDLVSFENLGLLLTRAAALCANMEHGAGDSEEEDTESFNEEDCLFMEHPDAEDDEIEVTAGTFCHSAQTGTRHSSSTATPHSENVRPSPANYHEEHGVYNDAKNVHVNDQHSSSFSIVMASSTTSPPKRARKAKRNMLSTRESLLAETWERKREIMVQEEMVNMKESAKPELLGRSSSDCGKLVMEVQGSAEVKTLRTRSLTDHDFEELRGFIDLGFRFDQSVDPNLCETLPALEVYCAVAQSFQGPPSLMFANSPVVASPIKRCSPSPSPSWRVSSPGDDPKEVKGRLRHWAQAVACNTRLCS